MPNNRGISRSKDECAARRIILFGARQRGESDVVYRDEVVKGLPVEVERFWRLEICHQAIYSALPTSERHKLKFAFFSEKNSPDRSDLELRDRLEEEDWRWFTY